MSIHRPAAAAQHGDALLDTIEDLVGGQCLEARRGQFQGQGKSVEAAGELVELTELVGTRAAAGDRRHPIDEEPGCR